MKTPFYFVIFVSFILNIYVVDSAKADTVYLDDGGYYKIDDTRYQDDTVFLDKDITNNPGTHLELIAGSVVRWTEAYNNSMITINGGSGGCIYAHDSSTVEINSGGSIDMNAQDSSTVIVNGGTILNGFQANHTSIVQINGGTIGEWLVAENNSTIQMSGGTIGASLVIYGNSTAQVSGGFISWDIATRGSSSVQLCGGTVAETFEADDDSMIYLMGTNFSVTDLNGKITDLVWGDNLRDFGTLVDRTYDYYTGTITGTLMDGSVMDNEFKIYAGGAANIIVIPEPATLALLGLGGLLIRKRKS